MNKQLEQLSSKVETLKKHCKTEEATKHSFILPFFKALGYDVFDPEELLPEVDCDIRQSGDKVDYTISLDGVHSIIVECKHWTKNLNNFEAQLRSYFVASSARIAILTNGIEYRFYTDTEKANLMDETPFYVLDMENLTEQSLETLYLFEKSNFSESKIISKAIELKAAENLRDIVFKELSDPSLELVSYFTKCIYGQTLSKSFREQIKPILKKVIHEYCMKPIEINASETTPQATELQNVLTLVRRILKDVISPDRIQIDTGKQYTSIRLDGNVWFPIIKCKITDTAKWIVVSQYNSETNNIYGRISDRHYIASVNDILNYSDDIISITKQILQIKQ